MTLHFKHLLKKFKAGSCLSWGYRKIPCKKGALDYFSEVYLENLLLLAATYSVAYSSTLLNVSQWNSLLEERRALLQHLKNFYLILSAFKPKKHEVAKDSCDSCATFS